MSLPLPRLAILGTGSMGGAILTGLLASEAEPVGITVTNRSADKAARLGSDRVVSLATDVDPDANRTAVHGARIVIVAVKPAMVPDLLSSIAGALEPDALVVSVAAGVTVATMEALVPQAVFRSMPNTPSVVGRGVTGLARGTRASDDDAALVRSFFEAFGVVVEVDEGRINALSAISGSGPAYVFYLIEQLTQTAGQLGFDPEQARTMVEQTFLGASELLAASDAGPAELRRRVTSPNGTTERAIQQLEAADLTGLFDRATAAAIARAEEMARGA